MKNIKFGIASGIIVSLVYLFCILSLMIVKKIGLIFLSNVLFDGAVLMEMEEVSLFFIKTISGVLITFFVWGFVGYLAAYFYNLYILKNSI